MENLIRELRALAERVAGGPVHVDVTWVVSAVRWARVGVGGGVAGDVSQSPVTIVTVPEHHRLGA